MCLLFFLADSDRILQGFGTPKKIYCKEFTPKGPIPPEFNGLLSVPNNPDH